MGEEGESQDWWSNIKDWGGGLSYIWFIDWQHRKHPSHILLGIGFLCFNFYCFTISCARRNWRQQSHVRRQRTPSAHRTHRFLLWLVWRPRKVPSRPLKEGQSISALDTLKTYYTHRNWLAIWSPLADYVMKDIEQSSTRIGGWFWMWMIRWSWDCKGMRKQIVSGSSITQFHRQEHCIHLFPILIWQNCGMIVSVTLIRMQ